MAYSSPVTLTPVDVQIDFMEPKQQKPEPVILDVVKMSGKGKSPLTKGLVYHALITTLETPLCNKLKSSWKFSM